MDGSIKDFIADATLLFIATSNADGAIDVSPRGGQPSVLALTEGGELLLPDYRGNRRLDTIGNLLARPDCALAILRRGSDRYLRARATAEVSFAPELLARFPADESRPISVLRLVPESLELVETTAFKRTGFWQDTPARKPPLDLVQAITEDKASQAEAGRSPVLKNAAEEVLLMEQGVRAVYGSSSEGVQKKVGVCAGPGSLPFMSEAQFTVFAHRDAADRLQIDLNGEAPLEPVQRNNRHGYRLPLAPEVAVASGGQAGVLSIAVGRAEILRVNGDFAQSAPGDAPEVTIFSEEVFFHCPAALNRARTWQADRRVPWIGKRDFRVTARREETPQVTSFEFTPEDDAPVGDFLPGQYVTLSLPDDPEQGRQRCYSLSSAPGGERLRITVRRLGLGGLSDRLHDGLEVGGRVQLGIPAGRFTFSSPPTRPAALISAGVGITPMISMLAHLAPQPREAALWFVHCARDLAHHPLRAEVETLLATQTSGRIRSFTALSQPKAGERSDHEGRLSVAALAQTMPLAEMDLYLCGPEPFMTEFARDLRAFGVPERQIHMEAFVPGAGSGLAGLAMDEQAAHEVIFAKSGRSAIWQAKAGSLLDLALAEGVRVPYACRNGECQSCLQRILEGTVAYPMGDLPVLGQGQVLLCQSVPKGRLILDC